MTSTVAGALLGAILAAGWLIFGFWGFVLIAVFMGIGALVAMALSGRLDLRALVGAFSGRRTS